MVSESSMFVHRHSTGHIHVYCLVVEEMDAADNELREVICNIWPNHAKKQLKLHEGGTKSLLDLVVPPKHGEYGDHYCRTTRNDVNNLELHGTPSQPKLTVGKVYALNLYIDNYRSYKQGHSNDGVSISMYVNSFFLIVCVFLCALVTR
jgi:hypothetical protein